MNIFSKIKAALGSSTAKPIVAAVTAVATNAFDQGVVAAKGTEIGTAAMTAVKAAETSAAQNPGMTNAAKKTTAVAAVVPVVALYVAKKGLAATMADLETFAGQVIESVLADLKSTGPMAIAEAVLQLAVAAA